MSAKLNEKEEAMSTRQSGDELTVFLSIGKLQKIGLSPALGGRSTIISRKTQEKIRSFRDKHFNAVNR